MNSIRTNSKRDRLYIQGSISGSPIGLDSSSMSICLDRSRRILRDWEGARPTPIESTCCTFQTFLPPLAMHIYLPPICRSSVPSPSLIPCLLSTLSSQTLYTSLPVRRRLPIPLPCHLSFSRAQERRACLDVRGEVRDPHTKFLPVLFLLLCYCVSPFNSLTLLQQKIKFLQRNIIAVLCALALA